MACPAKYGGDLTFTEWQVLERAYLAGAVHPTDLKAAVTTSLIQLLKPIRDYFETHRDMLTVFS